MLTTVGLDTFFDPRRQGGKMNDATREDLVRVVEFDGQEWLYMRSIPVDVAIIRATTADEHGNLTMEHEGAPLGAYDQALAAHNNGGIVIAQVKRLVPPARCQPSRCACRACWSITSWSRPTRCRRPRPIYDPAISGEIRRPGASFRLAPWNADKVIARRAALELRAGDAVNLGFGISALVPRILLEEGLADAVTWVIEQGAVGGVPLLDFQFGCAANAQALIPSPDQFTYFQGGGFDRSLLSFMQVDRFGNVNVSRLAAKPHVTAGAGGFIDITARARNLVFSGYFTAGGLELAFEDGELRIVKEGRARKFVADVEHVTFSGRRALAQGQQVVYITERCVLRLEARWIDRGRGGPWREPRTRCVGPIRHSSARQPRTPIDGCTTVPA